MSPVLRWSLILVAAVTGLNVVILVAGLHQSPVGGQVFIVLAIVFNIVAVVMALRETRLDNPYGKQLVNGLLIGVVAGVLILLTSWVVLSFVFPASIQEMIDGNVALVESAADDQAVKDQRIAVWRATTAVSQSMAGLFGTLFTSIVVAAIAGAFLRKK